MGAAYWLAEKFTRLFRPEMIKFSGQRTAEELIKFRRCSWGLLLNFLGSQLEYWLQEVSHRVGGRAGNRGHHGEDAWKGARAPNNLAFGKPAVGILLISLGMCSTECPTNT